MDYITVSLEDGRKEKMEVVTIYEMSNSYYHYIIYRDVQNHYYVGKYLGEAIVELNTNLDENEMVFAQGILDGLVGR